jgi:hypothetical protein
MKAASTEVVQDTAHLAELIERHADDGLTQSAL